jgi:hypothetical protein
MSHERWAKRRDEAVESSWLRGLRDQAKVARTPRHLFVPNPAAAKQPGSPLRDRSIVAGLDR